MMEIKKNNIDKINFFEFDDIIYEKDSEMYFMNKQIYIINWNIKIENSSLLISKIRNIHNDEMSYSADIKSNSEISLIFNLYNNKLIGKNGGKSDCLNRGRFFQLLCREYIHKYNYIKKFKNECRYKYTYEYNKNIINEIHILI